MHASKTFDPNSFDQTVRLNTTVFFLILIQTYNSLLSAYGQFGAYFHQNFISSLSADGRFEAHFLTHLIQIQNSKWIYLYFFIFLNKDFLLLACGRFEPDFNSSLLILKINDPIRIEENSISSLCIGRRLKIA